MDVVVVESPAKAKTINKYLGSGYTVLASFGHVRDLPPKDGSVRPDEDFRDELAGTRSRRPAHLRDCQGRQRRRPSLSRHRPGPRRARRSRGMSSRCCATRACWTMSTSSAWSSTKSPRTPYSTPCAIRGSSMTSWSRPISRAVRSTIWLALRCHRCYGENCPAAARPGRVQSVALRLICERELEIEVFNPEEYWTVRGRVRDAARREIHQRA